VIRPGIKIRYYLNYRYLHGIRCNNKVNCTRSMVFSPLPRSCARFNHQSPALNEIFHLALTSCSLSFITIPEATVTVEVSGTHPIPVSIPLQLLHDIHHIHPFFPVMIYVNYASVSNLNSNSFSIPTTSIVIPPNIFPNLFVCL
jgi:hypothetical protein